ncbi:MAG TPA: DUF4445 domain-containing protein, partial [Candidatus Hydrogenedentes bacterium]|nr:DUF4445 domain-containing protein [Candidatus Hydrogenedentota bacterium]
MSEEQGVQGVASVLRLGYSGGSWGRLFFLHSAAIGVSLFMQAGHVEVKFEPLGRKVDVGRGTQVLRAAMTAGIAMDTPCGGHGTCGKCRVFLSGSVADPTETERSLLSEEEVARGMRLACQSRVAGACTIEVPESSTLEAAYQILAGPNGAASVGVSDPVVRKRFIALPEPSRDDAAPDLERVEQALGAVSTDVELMRVLPERLRDAAWRGTFVLYDSRLIDFEAGDTSGACYGMAFDVGTTTVVGVLLDLVTGDQRATCSRMNPQTRFGDDVLSRILHATQEPGGLAALQEAILDEIASMTQRMAEDAGVALGHIYDVTFAGNTTMLHLLAGIPPRALGQVPFVPAFHRGLAWSAADLGLPIHTRAGVHIFPV